MEKRKTHTSSTVKNRYNRKTYRQYIISARPDGDQDIIAKLDSVPNKAGYIKALIRADIKKQEEAKMRYPAHNSTILDTGLRKLDIISLFGEDTESYGGTHAVFSARLTRRADAITTEGDIWEPDKAGAYLAVGDISVCLAFISAQVAPTDGRVMYDAPGKMIWADLKHEAAYIDALRPLCDDGETLGLNLNYAAAIKNGYAPYAPGYNPHKMPIV